MKKNFIFLIIGLFSSFIGTSQIEFQNNANAIGVVFTCGTPYLGSGVSVYDFDNDGWDDISFASGFGTDVQFFKNNNGNFTNLNLNIPFLGYQTKQLNWIDFDNDNDNDLFITSNTNGNRLFENLGNLNFQDITISAGFSPLNTFTSGAAWGDYNNDGFLDVFLANKDTTIDTQTPNQLFRNNGDGTFTDVSIIAGIDSLDHLSFCASFFDFNNDGWQDIYISNDKGYKLNQLYKNNGNGTFTEVGASSGSDVGISAMTVTIGDYNSDGWFDIYITNLGNSVFLRNNGDETFTDIALASGTEFGSTGWGAVFLDADNDKDLDLYVSGSLYSHPTLLSDAFFENLNNGTFQIPNNSGFENIERNSYSNAVGDINNDGLLDIVVTNGNNQNVLVWENQNTEGNNWLKVNLEGVTSNRDGIGSVIEININGESQYRYTQCGQGYIAQNSGTEVFGVGTSTIIDYVKVSWLSGEEDIFTNVSVNQTLNITEGSSTLGLSNIDNSSFSVYPNPTENKVYIKSQLSITEVRLYDILHKEIDISYNAIDGIDLSNLKSGVYFLTIINNRKSETVKIIKK